MGKEFIVKKLAESYEIQKSYDNRNYFEAVMKCRSYLESWLLEYIYAILYPTTAQTNKKNREQVESQFNSMFIQLTWLLQQNYIAKKDYDNMNKIRIFCDDVINKGNALKVAPMNILNGYIEATVHYCYMLKENTRVVIEKATGQKIQF